LLRRAALVVVTCALVLAALGGWAGRGRTADQERLEHILALLEVHPTLLWRQRAHLDTRFEGTAVFTDDHGFRLSSAGAQRPETADIVVLGASPTFGYGVEADETYAAVAAARLEAAGADLSVFNAGSIGYSSLQGLRLARANLERWSPKLVTVSYVVNDIDRYRFFLTNGRDDLGASLPTPARAARSNFMRSFGPTAFLMRLSARLAGRLATGGSPRPIYELRHVRTEISDYGQNLRDLVALIREQDAAPLFVQMSFRLPELVPDRPEGLVERQQEVERLLEAGRYQEGLSLVESLGRSDPLDSRTHYLRGRLLEATGSPETAEEAYGEAFGHIIYDCVRDARQYNEVMLRVARETGTPLLDLSGRLGERQADMSYFVPGDYIHPNAAGQAYIGECLADVAPRVLAGEAVPEVVRCP